MPATIIRRDDNPDRFHKCDLTSTPVSRIPINGEIRQCTECKRYWIYRQWNVAGRMQGRWYELTKLGVWIRKKRGIISEE